MRSSICKAASLCTILTIFRKADALLQKISSKVVGSWTSTAESHVRKDSAGVVPDGRVTAVLGTHTHVPRQHSGPAGWHGVSNDVEMTGPYDSVIGVQKEQVLQRFLTGLPDVLKPASDPRFCAVLIGCDEATGRAHSVQRLMLGE